MKSKNVLLVFAKYPQPGNVKTRLARSTGADEAVYGYRNPGRDI